MEPQVPLSCVEALLIHRLVLKDRPVYFQVNRLTPAWLIRSNSRFLRQEAWNERNAPAKTPLLMKLAQRPKTGERAALSLHTPQNSWEPIQVSGAIPKRWLWSSEESWDLQASMWRLREDEVKEKTMDRSSTSPLGHFRDFLKCARVSVSGPAAVY